MYQFHLSKNIMTSNSLQIVLLLFENASLGLNFECHTLRFPSLQRIWESQDFRAYNLTNNWRNENVTLFCTAIRVRVFVRCRNRSRFKSPKGNVNGDPGKNTIKSTLRSSLLKTVVKRRGTLFLGGATDLLLSCVILFLYCVFVLKRRSRGKLRPSNLGLFRFPFQRVV